MKYLTEKEKIVSSTDGIIMIELNAYECLCLSGRTKIKYNGRINRFDFKTFLPEDLLIKFCQIELGLKIDKSDLPPKKWTL